MTAPNSTVVANWETGKFGCARNCEYCDWRRSPDLPRGYQGNDSVYGFAAAAEKSQVTISGGGDPLYKPAEHLGVLSQACKSIREAGKQVRVITRETDHVHLLRGLADRVSISIDQESYRGALRHRSDWSGMEVEYSAVLPQATAAGINSRAAYYRQLRAKLGGRLALRENLYSFHRLNPAELDFLNPHLVLVTRELCLSARYLVGGGTVKSGYDLTATADLILQAAGDEAAVFGGAARNLAAPESNQSFSDVDMVSWSPAAMSGLVRLGYKFRPHLGAGGPGLEPLYWEGSTGERMGLPIHLLEFRTRSRAIAFVGSGQYDVSRVYWEGGRMASDPSYAEGCRAKRAVLLPQPEDAPRRAPGAFDRHRKKLASKGYELQT